MIKKMNRIINILKEIINNYFLKKELYFIVENADWVIRYEYSMIKKLTQGKYTSKIATVGYGIRNAIIHYGSINTFMDNGKIKLPHKSNKIIVTWFHIAPNDNRTELIKEAVKHVDLWHTSCQLTKIKLINLGIPVEKIIVIPIAVDLDCFYPISTEEKLSRKKEMNIPKNKIVIGYFQKDGNGWGEGLEPKLIKGPDIFCDVVEMLAKEYDLFILLTGPARGYVKSRLDKANIPYKHDYLKNPNEVSEYYKVIDLYMVTSREEGGPKAVMESMASGIPIISTKVGMAPDLIIDEDNGSLVEVEDVNALYTQAKKIIDDCEFRKNIINNAFETIKQFDFKIVAEKYKNKGYDLLS